MRVWLLNFRFPTRSLYFSEQTVGSNGPTQYFITVNGQRPKVFHMDDPPAIVTNIGAVEDWTVENRAGEAHAFHIHQIHFLVMAINGVPVPNPYLADTIVLPNWSGHGPYPNVTLRMDFRDPNIAGTFVYVKDFGPLSVDGNEVLRWSVAADRLFGKVQTASRGWKLSGQTRKALRFARRLHLMRGFVRKLGIANSDVLASTCSGFGLPTGPVLYPLVRNVPCWPTGRPGMMNSTRPAGGTVSVV